MEENWAKLPDGRKWGAAIGIEVDRDGKSIGSLTVVARMTAGSRLWRRSRSSTSTGKFMVSFGGGMFNFPHGLGVDREGNVWATDERGKNGKGAVAIKFSPDGKVLMTIGKPGMPGDGRTRSIGPSDVAIAANGDIYIADGHGGTTNDRIVKLSKDGKFIKAWGKHGKGPGELDTPHSIALDSTGRVFVADRVNSRIQIFDPDGKLLAEWKQSAGRAACSSTRTTSSTWPTANRTSSATRASSRASGSAVPRTARSRRSSPDQGADIGYAGSGRGRRPGQRLCGIYRQDGSAAVGQELVEPSWSPGRAPSAPRSGQADDRERSGSACRSDGTCPHCLRVHDPGRRLA